MIVSTCHVFARVRGSCDRLPPPRPLLNEPQVRPTDGELSGHLPQGAAVSVQDLRVSRRLTHPPQRQAGMAEKADGQIPIGSHPVDAVADVVPDPGLHSDQFATRCRVQSSVPQPYAPGPLSRARRTSFSSPSVSRGRPLRPIRLRQAADPLLFHASIRGPRVMSRMQRRVPNGSAMTAHFPITTSNGSTSTRHPAAPNAFVASTTSSTR